MLNIKDPTQFLLDSGLLFEINRRILHPLGLALAVDTANTPENFGLFSVQDVRDDPEGFIFEDEDLAEGQAKLEKFAAEQKFQQRLMTRRASLGFVIQTIPPEAEPPYPAPDRE